MTNLNLDNMKIEINDHRKIFAIQEEFSQLFPNITIGFYRKSNKSGGGPAGELVKSSSKTLLECRVSHQEGTITINPEMTYGELKQNFEDIYGLTILLSHAQKGNQPGEPHLIEASTLRELNKEIPENVPGKISA